MVCVCGVWVCAMVCVYVDKEALNKHLFIAGSTHYISLFGAAYLL